MRIPRILVAAAAVAMLVSGSAGAVFAGRLVYMGPDPSCHYTKSGVQALELAANAVRWAGNGSDPRILLVRAGCGSRAFAMLQNAGFTQITSISQSAFSSQTLSNFDVIYVTYSSNSSNFTSSAAAVQSFVDAGGGLVIEGNADSISWAPFGDLVGYNRQSDDTTTILDHFHPVMAGLTDAGLSSWGSSSHSEFDSPRAARFSTLANDGNAVADIIVFPESVRANAPAVGWPGIATLTAVLLAMGLYGIGLSRRPQQRI